MHAAAATADRHLDQQVAAGIRRDIDSGRWTHRDPGGRPVRVYEQVLPADRHVLVFTGDQDPDQDVP